MKAIILALAIICSVISVSQAGWYVVDVDNKVIVKCEYQPEAKDLEARNEVAVFSKEDIPLPDAEYDNGRIIRRIKTTAEIIEENKREDEEADKKLINEKLKAMAIEKLKSEGVVLRSRENK